jgi:hypothetical protein
VAYQDGSLYPVHAFNHNPAVVLREFPETRTKKMFSSILHHSAVDPITSLTWTVCETDKGISSAYHSSCFS